MIYFTSDTHFSHENIIRLCNRPFASKEQMTEELIKKWNHKVKNPNDTVYVLGDFAFGLNSKEIKELLNRLNGIKYLIIGNHDRIKPNELSNSWTEMVSYKELTIDNQKVILSHFPLAEWNYYYNNAYHLYGHTHGKFNLAKETLLRNKPNGNCWDVGVDNNNYEPKSWEEIKQLIQQNINSIKEENND